jgi:hypothetical protein
VEQLRKLLIHHGVTDVTTGLVPGLMSPGGPMGIINGPMEDEGGENLSKLKEELSQREKLISEMNKS